MKYIDAKAIRLCLEERVTVTWTNDDGTAASGIVDGETDTYRASFDPSGRSCTCEAARHHQICSHSIALELQVLREAEARQEVEV